MKGSGNERPSFRFQRLCQHRMVDQSLKNVVQISKYPDEEGLTMYRIIIILVLLLILFYMVRRAFRDWGQPKPPAATPGKDVMIQDPVCKTYVAAGTAVIEHAEGETYYFCSEDCARHFKRTNPS